MMTYCLGFSSTPSITNLLFAVLGAFCIANSIHGGSGGSGGLFVGACPLSLKQVCGAMKQDLVSAKLLGFIDIDGKCSCQDAQSVCNLLANNPPYDYKSICNQVKIAFLGGFAGNIVDCNTCDKIANTCNLLKSCKAPAIVNSSIVVNVVTMATASIPTTATKNTAMVHPIITANLASSDELMLEPSTMSMLSSTYTPTSATPISTQMVNSTQSVKAKNVQPSSALDESVIPSSSMPSSGYCWRKTSKVHLSFLTLILFLLMIMFG